MPSFALPAARCGRHAVALALVAAAPAVVAAQIPAPIPGVPPAGAPIAAPLNGPVASDTNIGTPITLASAIETAQRNAPSAIQAQGQVRGSRTAVRAAYAQFIPTVQFSTNLTRQSNVATRLNTITGELTSNRYQNAASVSASVELFDGFRRINDLRASRAEQSAAETGVASTNATLAFNVKQQYYAALAAREAELATQAQLAQAQQQLALSVAKVLAQTATRSDSLRGAIAVSQARLALLNAQNQRATADAALTRVIGSSTPVSAMPSGLPADSAFSADSSALAAIALENPTIRAAEADLTAARYAYRSSKAGFYPTVALTYGRNVGSSANNLDPFGPNYTTTGSLGLRLSLPLYDRLARQSNLVNAGIAQANAEAALKDQQLAAQQSLVQAITALRNAQAQIALQQQSVTAAEEDLRVQQQRYQLGVSTVLDVLTSQNQLTQASLSLVQARFSARTARAQLEQLIGRDL